MLGIDATHFIPGVDIKTAGYDFVGRYDLAGAYRVTPDEITDYHSNNLAVLFFGEHAANFMLGGANAGTSAGQDAHDYLSFLGAPPGVVEFFTCDFDAQPYQFPAIGAFLSAAGTALYPYLPGIYGGINVVEAFPGYPSFQTEAWSHGIVSPHANYYQRVGTTLPPINGTTPGQYDEDIAIAPVGFWGVNDPSPPPITPQAEDDSVITINYNGTDFHVWASGGSILYRAWKGGLPQPIAHVSGTYNVNMDNPRPLVVGPFIFFAGSDGKEIRVAPSAFGLVADTP
jgi:hypothetical protein